MTQATEKTVQGSEAESTQGTETGTNPLSILGNMAVTEVAEESTTEADTDKESQDGSATDTTGAEDGTESEATATQDESTAETGKERVEFTPDQQRVFNERLGKEVAKRKAEQEKAEAAASKAQSLEGELATLKAAAESRIPLHPEWAEKTDLDAIVESNRLEDEVARLKENWNGVEDEKDPTKSMTAQQVQQRYAQAVAELAALKPKAVEAWNKAHQQFLDDARAGRKLRLERAKAAEVAAKGAAATGKTTVVPAGSGAAGKAVTTPAIRGGQSRERFEKLGGTREAAEKELAELVAV